MVALHLPCRAPSSLLSHMPAGLGSRPEVQESSSPQLWPFYGPSLRTVHWRGHKQSSTLPLGLWWRKEINQVGSLTQELH